MNPADFLLLLMSLVMAAGSISLEGWTLNGVGPAVLALAAGVWQLGMQWLRDRSWLHHRGASTQESGSW